MSKELTERGTRNAEHGVERRRALLLAASNPHSAFRNPHSERGVAIILVLGLLAVLMLAAVAFSISMRIERKGASAFRHSVQARHMVWVALAEAIHDIDYSMTNSNFYIYPQNSTNGSCVYPEWYANVMASSVSGNFSPSNVYVMSSTAVKYIPGSLTDAVQGAKPCWQKITDAGGEVRGRYAYVAVNCSGLLDANKVGGMSRMCGTNSQEIQIGNLSDVSSVANFLADRDRDVRYETLPELAYLNSGVTNAPENFAVYSLAPVGERLVVSSKVGAAKTNIWGNVDDLIAKKADVKAGLIASGIAAGEADFVFNNLIDYLDTNCVPYALDMPYTEAVPMISEFYVTNVIRLVIGSGVTNAQARPSLAIELHYPFVKPSPYQFGLYAEMKATFSNTDTGAANSNVLNATVDSGYIAGNTERFWRNVDYGNKDYVIAGMSLQVPATNGANVKLECEVRAWVTEPGGSLVDAAPYPANLYIALPEMTAVVPELGDKVGQVTGKECIDPRFNWGTAGQFWHVYYPPWTDTLGTTNSSTLDWFNSGLHPGLDQGISMHVSNTGRLFSVGELGNLLLGSDNNSKFKTIRLYDRDSDYRMNSVLEHFTITNAMKRGLVNLNTKNTNVLAAVFLNAPLRWDSDSGMTLAQSDALSIANAVIAGNTNYFDVGDIGYANQVNWTAILPNMSDLERESIISHSDGLLTVRQNIFTIILITESYSMNIGGEEATTGIRLASARAVAEVWRDPFRDGNGNHRCFIRYLKILED